MGFRTLIVRGCVAVALIGTLAFAGQFPSANVATAAVPDPWLTTINIYRAMSGLAPVTENIAWSVEDLAHSCYMLSNGISHDEVAGAPGYTAGGHTAGISGNVAVNSGAGTTARNHIDLWMTGPFHAIGILRANLVTTGFGLCTNPTTSPWKSGATLDVLRGVDWQRAGLTTAVVFPGRGATIALDHFVQESPNPVALCNWTGAAGLPLIALMPGVVTSANATLVGPNGPVETCVLHGGNTGADGTAQSILSGDDAVVVLPRAPLAPGTYTATVTTTGGNVTWSFTIDPNAVLQMPSIDVPDTAVVSAHSTFGAITPIRFADSRANRMVVRLQAGAPVTVDIGGADITAVSANFTVDRPSADGFLTVYNCTATVPEVSTLNFTTGTPVPNQAFVPLSHGNLCLFSPVDTDIIIDINGYFRAQSGTAAGFVPLTPKRLYDTRQPGMVRLAPGEVRQITVEEVPGGAPSTANAVAVNLTVVAPSNAGFISAYPCGAVPEVSNVNFAPSENRPNSAVVPTNTDGTICIVSTTTTDLLVDISGYFVVNAGFHYTSLVPVRLLDTRSIYPELNPLTAGATLTAGQIVRLPVAGLRGVPTNAKSVSVNITATAPIGDGFVTAYPCGDAVPNVSNLNMTTSGPDIANGALTPLATDGSLCLYTSTPVHLLVDINGVWS